MSFDALSALLLIPALSAGALALLPGYRLTAQLNVLAEGQVEEIPARLWREQLGIGRKKRTPDAHDAPWKKPEKPEAPGKSGHLAKRKRS